MSVEWSGVWGGGEDKDKSYRGNFFVRGFGLLRRIVGSLYC